MTNHALMRSELRVEPPHSISQSREVAYLATLIRSKSQVRILPLHPNGEGFGLHSIQKKASAVASPTEMKRHGHSGLLKSVNQKPSPVYLDGVIG